MSVQRSFAYKDYVLHCEPRAMTEGGFVAQVYIQYEEATMGHRSPSLGQFNTEHEAILHAKQWAEAWVQGIPG
ncbi:MAG: hypothetical protein ABSF50_01990 [Burkholderiaceae bacterium]|jgi:hypothetical protein